MAHDPLTHFHLCFRHLSGADPGICKGGRKPLSSIPHSLPLPLLPPLLSPFPPFPMPHALPSLEVGPFKAARGSGGALYFPSAVRGGAPAENEFGAL